MGKLEPEDKAICRIAVLTGYRIDDIIRSQREDWNGETITLREAKTGKKRTVYNCAEIRAELKELDKSAVRRRRAGELCPGRRQRKGDGPYLARSTIWRHWKTAARKAGYAGRGYTVHSLRRCYAVGIWKRTRDLEAVRQDLGHDRSTTTWIYLQDALEAALRSI